MRTVESFDTNRLGSLLAELHWHFGQWLVELYRASASEWVVTFSREASENAFLLSGEDGVLVFESREEVMRHGDLLVAFAQELDQDDGNAEDPTDPSFEN